MFKLKQKDKEKKVQESAHGRTKHACRDRVGDRCAAKERPVKLWNND